MIIPPAIAEFLTASLGMAKDAVGRESLSRALAQVMRREGIADPEAYEKLFKTSEEARQRLVDAVVVGETWFFRDRGPFVYLARQAPEMLPAGARSVLKILSAPCSTGEEPYSIAMSLLAAGLPPASFRIEGVDISRIALEMAQRATYGNGSFRGNIGAEMASFFEKTPSGRRVIQPVRAQVAFFHDNLTSERSLLGRGPYAVIFCRNLLIYLTHEARRQVFVRLDRLLIPGGLLFAGHTETVFWHQQGYLPVQSDRAFALIKPACAPAAGKPKPAAPVKAPPPAPVPRAVRTPAPAARPQERHSAADRKPPTQPATAEATLSKARLLADKGEMDKALRLCREYSRTFGPSAGLFGLMGLIRVAQQDSNDAEDFFHKALYLDPDHYESLVHMSLLYARKGDTRRAALYRARAERLAGRTDNTSPGE